MRIAHLSSLYHPVPPVFYGGSQRVISQIAIAQALYGGHDVTVYASADSTLIDEATHQASLKGMTFSGDNAGRFMRVTTPDGRTGRLRLRSTDCASLGSQIIHQEEEHARLIACMLADEARNPYQVIHAHKHLFLKPLIDAGFKHKTFLHAHDNKQPPDWKDDIPLISISGIQDRLLKDLGFNTYGPLYNTLDKSMYHAGLDACNYVCSLGAMKMEKGHDLSIAIAKSAGKPLIIAGCPDSRPASQMYFFDRIKPHLDHEDTHFFKKHGGRTASEIDQIIQGIASECRTDSPVIYVGAVDDGDKQYMLGHASALLFPIRWQEPFGLVAIEAMACGCPVIGNTGMEGQHCGATREVINNGLTGFHIEAANEPDCIEKSAEALKNIPRLDRHTIRDVFETRWSNENMVPELDKIYNERTSRALRFHNYHHADLSIF